MQDRYAGDVGDFGKYGLLRAITAGRPRLRLGLVWYLVDEHTVARDPRGDGRHITYLTEPALYEDCDPPLYDAMRALIASGDRSVAAVGQLGILPPRTVTYAAPLVTPPRTIRADVRVEVRRQWLEGALQRTAPCDLVFLDPDNGLETASSPKHSARASKYVYFDEVAEFGARDQTLIIYHHLGRVRPHLEEVAYRIEQCREVLQREVWALRFRRGTARIYLIAPTPAHAPILDPRIERMLAGPWSRHFERLA